MPPAWLRSLQEHIPQVGSVKVPDVLYHTDWSKSLANAQLASTGTFNEGFLAGLALPGQVSVMAFEPVLGYLAVGTTEGTIHLFGSPPVQISFPLRPSNKVRFLAFKSGTGLLVCIDEKDNISIFDLERPDPQIRASYSSTKNQYRASSASGGHNIAGPPHPDTPMRVGVYTARNKVVCIELSPAHSHLFMGLRDGTVDAYDLESFSPSPYRVPNLWWEEEEILRKSGVPDAPNRRHIPLIIDIKTHPKDINQLLLAYEGGAILLDVKDRAVLKTFQLRLLPGAPGPGGDPNLVWTERSSPATCVAWRPDGEVFAMGHEDGCISFWYTKHDERPLMVRALDRIDIDKPQAFTDDGGLGRPQREPIFKLAWSGFPEKSWMEMASENAASWQSTPEQNTANAENKEALAQPSPKGTILTILGGANATIDPPGLHCIHFPSYSSSINLWGSNSSEVVQKVRQELKQSLFSHMESFYRTPSQVEDFMLLPKINPHFGNAYDPMGVVTLLAANPALPTLPPPAAARGLACYVFPPNVPFVSSPTSEPTATFSSPNLPASDPIASPSLPPRVFVGAQKELHLPLALIFAGPGAILGAKFAAMSPHAYRKLVGLNDVSGVNQKQDESNDLISLRSSQDDGKDPLKLLGGKASASLSGEGPDSIYELAKKSKFRILITWHLDGTVRFYDASPQLLLVGDMDEQDLAYTKQLPRIWLKRGFPSPLSNLTISTRELLQHESMFGHPTFDRIRSRAKIKDVQFASEMLEVGVCLSTGQLLHYRFDFAKLSETRQVQNQLTETGQQSNLKIPPVQHAKLSASASSPSVGFHSDLGPNMLDQEMSKALEELETGADDSPTTKANVAAPFAGRPMSDMQRSVTMQNNLSSRSNGGPPPRPRRDPKRLSTVINFGRSTKPTGLGSEAASMTSSVSEGQLNRIDSVSMASPHNRMPPPPPSMSSAQLAEEITSLNHVADYSYDGFKPNLMVDLMRGEITAFTLSEIGFISIACATVLAVVDLRGSELILREGFGDSNDFSMQNKDESREARKLLEAGAKSPISLLCLTVARIADDASLAPRLIVSRENGFTTVWTLQKTLDMWLVERTSAHKLEEMAGLKRLEILDIGGNACLTLPNDLQRSLREQQHGPLTRSLDGRLPDANVSLGFTDTTISLRFGITGPVIHKTEVGEKILGASLIERATDKVAAVVTGTSIRLFSLPKLEQITRLQRHYREQGESLGTSALISFDAHGDFVEVCSSLDVRLWTVFGSLTRPGQPNLTLCPQPPMRTMPFHPGAAGFAAAGVATSIAGWFGNKKAADFLSVGAQLDAILAGPSRPDPPKLGPPLAPRDYRPPPPADPNTTREGEPKNLSTQDRKPHRSKEVVEMSDEATSTGQQTLDLLKARGAMMNGIEDGLSALERGASNFVKNTRDMAVKSAAKDKLNKLFF